VAVFFTWVTEFADQALALCGLLFGLALLNVFVPPIPIETISLFMGYLVASEHVNALEAWLALGAGMAVGSTILYYLARRYGKHLFTLKWVRNQVTPERLNQVEAWFKRRGLWIVFAGKLVPGMSFATVLAVGLFGAQPRPTLIAIYVANALYFAVTVALGYYLGENWHDVIDVGRRIWPWALGLLIVVVTIRVIVWYKSRKPQPQEMK
jgi:membrane protein DedA with SNARE-associated domain